MVQETHNSSKKALGHLRVIEIGEEIGEFCCKTFADMGADVIRIEPPGGAQTRDIGPFYKNERNPERSLHFWIRRPCPKKPAMSQNPEIAQSSF